MLKPLHEFPLQIPAFWGKAFYSLLLFFSLCFEATEFTIKACLTTAMPSTPNEYFETIKDVSTLVGIFFPMRIFSILYSRII